MCTITDLAKHGRWMYRSRDPARRRNALHIGPGVGAPPTRPDSGAASTLDSDTRQSTAPHLVERSDFIVRHDVAGAHGMVAIEPH